MLRYTISIPPPSITQSITALLIAITLGLIGENFTIANDEITVDFGRDIRPILAGYCWHCHGPDANTRKADLRLDDSQSAIAERGGYRVIHPGKPDQSELLKRVTTDDPNLRMPPTDSPHPKLSADQVKLLSKWIGQGATWSAHWSFVVPQRPPAPKVKDPSWVVSSIDSFILDRLQREGLQPSSQAGRENLARRVTLALTGLPPTPEELDAFLSDNAPDSYDRLVDRLLHSPRYGEHMALGWLDAARYADTSGYQADWERFMWPWRDWVVEAFNLDLPFDQFTVEQLAGDMLPGATMSQALASGFNRNHRINDEGGSLDAEFEVEYVVDRVDTTGTVWLGLTFGCARCHDHKYEPISQKEYYRLFAFFNNVPEKGIDGRKGAAKPFIDVPNQTVAWQLDRLRKQLDELQIEQARVSGGSADASVLAKRVGDLKETIKKLEPKAVTQVQVMHELPGRRPTYLLVRGAYDNPDKSEQLFPALPTVFGRLPAGGSVDRLALARWLVGPDNPLTARVAANRLWQHHFGSGLVRSAEDFGSRGERPTHPELLDWLATELVERNWEVKAFHRLIVSSSTYRQASQVTPELLARDSGNRLLARGPRRRLTGGAIRDLVLFTSGLLSPTMGGPPVKPYQPTGLWEELSFGNGKTSVDFYVQDHGESLYRRSLYTFWKRTVAPPGMSVFDGGGREMCRVSFDVTNTPMQALTLQNDITFVEAARHLAGRMLHQGGTTSDEKLAYGWRLVLSRQPTPGELAVLHRSLERYRSNYALNLESAAKLTSVGESSRDSRLEPAEQAAFTMVAQTILNLDESIVLE